ncbi:hypothetical protein J2Y69_001563 [Microbacterium resistens]|uniref:Uncharacterized protein n=1 Tax=Microbacterium resistens TaxID=156977 RepID=A0ABU1SBH7_9MICO|nr:daptide-type RiPP [Microbacterium resistens]MDR6866964.1 hypothetical protein [Microbacterium resistens]
MELSQQLRFEEIESMEAPDSDMYVGFKLAVFIGLIALVT